MTTIDDFKAHLGFFNKDYVRCIETQVEITEKKAGGEGTVTFDLPSESILLKAHDNAPVVWCLHNEKCAEGGFVTFAEDGAHLHIVELKSSLNDKQWAKVQKQFEGMFLSALAVFGIFKISTLSSVTCYIAYKDDKIKPATTSSPILNKPLVGGIAPMGGQHVWKTGHLQLPHNTPAAVKKIQRDAGGNAHYGQV